MRPTTEILSLAWYLNGTSPARSQSSPAPAKTECPSHTNHPTRSCVEPPHVPVDPPHVLIGPHTSAPEQTVSCFFLSRKLSRGHRPLPCLPTLSNSPTREPPTTPPTPPNQPPRIPSPRPAPLPTLPPSKGRHRTTHDGVPSMGTLILFLRSARPTVGVIPATRPPPRLPTSDATANPTANQPLGHGQPNHPKTHPTNSPHACPTQ